MFKRRIGDLSIADIPTQSEIERKRLARNIIIMTVATLIILSLLISLWSTYNIIRIADGLPNVALLKAYKPDQATLIYDINDKLIANIHGDEDRVVVTLDKISPDLQRAVIAIEDNRFYDHKGIDLIGTIRAGTMNFLSSGDSIQGGSTLTQQLVKNAFLSPERSLKRKLIEAILAVRVEKIFDKNKILEMYLNQIYWGNLSYGAEKAARRYFKKPARDLDLAESAMLAGLIKAPEAYSPYTNFKGAKLRQKLVLERMQHYGYITYNQRIQAQNQPLKFASRKQSYSKYPYFIDYVAYVLRQTYGEDVVRKGGLRVYTTLDPKVQEIAEKVIKEGVKSVSKGSGVKQGALVSINVDNGYVQALVGGVDYKQSNFNRAVFSKRAAGSSFKPVVYLTGLRVGKITSQSSIVDAPISFNTGWNIWSPHNWDGKYMGKMTVRKALTLSRNTPTVRVALKVGLDAIIETSRLLGIKSSLSRNFSIVLGSAGVSPLEMATVYSTLAREGVYIEPTVIRRVEDSDYNILEAHEPNPIQVVSPNFVRELNSILVDVVDKGTGKLAKLEDRKIAGKTGTTDDVRDIWFSGFTPDTATIIWMGNDENKELHGVFSSNCAQLWGLFSKEYYKVKDISPRYFNLNYKTESANKKPADKDSELKKKNKEAKTSSKKIKKAKAKKAVQKDSELLEIDKIKDSLSEPLPDKKHTSKKSDKKQINRERYNITPQPKEQPRKPESNEKQNLAPVPSSPPVPDQGSGTSSFQRLDSRPEDIE